MMTCQDKDNLSSDNEELYRYYSRSEGVWNSDLALVTVKLINTEDVLSIAEHYELTQIDFGVQVTWKYNQNQNKDKNKDINFEYLMNCCTDSEQPGLMFCRFGSNVTEENIKTDDRGRILKEVIPDMKSLILNNTFIALDYIFVDSDTLITKSGKYKATTRFETDRKRFREETYDGRVVRRVWEEKL